MSQSEAKQSEIAKRYGNVLFELAQEKGILDKILKNAKTLLGLLQKDLRVWKVVSSPIVSLDTQGKVIEKIGNSLKLEKLMLQFLRAVLYNRRLSYLSMILEGFMISCREATGAIEGTFETATTLPPKPLKHLEETLTKALGKAVSLETYTNERLLGGGILRIGSFMVDASVQTRLNKLRDIIKE